MSNQKYTGQQRQNFRERLARIELLIPANYSEIIANKLKGISKDTVRNVRHGKTINFPVLKALESLSEKAIQTST